MTKNLYAAWVAGLLLVLANGCGNNPEDKETTRIDRTRNFSRNVRGAYVSKAGNQIEFTKGKNVELTVSESFEVVAMKSNTNRIKVSIVTTAGQSGYANDVYITTEQDLSSIDLDQPFKTTLNCQYIHRGEIDKIYWLPRPRDNKNVSWEIQSLREQSEDVNFSMHFKDLHTSDIDTKIGKLEHEIIGPIVADSKEVLREASGFCSDESYRAIYNKDDYGSPILPMKSYSEEKVEFLQFEGHQVLKLGPASQQPVTSEVFEKR